MKPLFRKRLALSTLCVIGIAACYLAYSHTKQAVVVEEIMIVRHDGKRLVVPQTSPLRRSLTIQIASIEAIVTPLSLPASVETDPAKLVKVLPPIAGRIVGLNKRLGDAVHVGDILFSIDSADFSQAQSDAKKARATLALARQSLERQHLLDKAELAATRDVEQAQNDYEQASSELGRANARLAQLGAAISQADEGHVLTVRSPIAGHVVDLNAALGAYWNDISAPVMTVADLSTVFITASAQEKDLPHLYIGQSASVMLDAYPDQLLSAKVRYIGELLDAETRTVKVRIQFDNHDGHLKPGMFASMTLSSHPRNGILLPATAVLQSGFYSRVFVEVAAWQFEARIVTLGAQLDDKIEIVAGLKPGERVVVTDGVLLND